MTREEIVKKYTDLIILDREGFDESAQMNLWELMEDFIFELLPTEVEWESLEKIFDQHFCKEVNTFHSDIYSKKCKKKWIESCLKSYITDKTKRWDKEKMRFKKMIYKGFDRKTREKYDEFISNSNPINNSKKRLKEEMLKWDMML